MTKSEILNTMKLLGIKEVTTPKQALNGTREFELPIKYPWGTNIRVASFKTGYVRNQNGASSNYQLNKCKMNKRYYKYSDGKVHEFDTKERILIPNEVDRLEYLLKFAVRNYYTKPQVQVKKQVINIEPEVSVIVNGHRYNL